MTTPKPVTFAYARKRTKDNLIWLLIFAVLLGATCSCTGTRATHGCQLTRGFVGYR